MRRPLVSVITAFGRPEYDYLAEAGSTLLPMTQPPLGTRQDVQWVIALDGPVDETQVGHAVHHLDMDVTLTRNASSVRGPGPTRNAGLLAATGRWVHALDADDWAYPAGVLELIDAAQRQNVGWAAGRCDDVRDGVAGPWGGPDPFNEGLIPVGAFLDFKVRTGAIPFILNASVARRSLVLASGGWPVRQMARGEDTALWAVMTCRSPGAWVPVTAMGYRRHAASMTQAPGFCDLPEDLDLLRNMVAAGTTQADTLLPERGPVQPDG